MTLQNSLQFSMAAPNDLLENFKPGSQIIMQRVYISKLSKTALVDEEEQWGNLSYFSALYGLGQYVNEF